MPERVETGGTRGARYTKPVERRIQHVLPKHVRIKRETIFLAEDKVIGFLPLCRFAMPFQCCNKYSTKVYRPNAAFCLWRYQLPAPKTKGSIRTINLGAVLVAALKRHRESAERKKPNDFVFCKKDGFPFDPDVLRKDVLYPTLDRLGIPRPSGASGFHAFRHSVGSFINTQTGNLSLHRISWDIPRST